MKQAVMIAPGRIEIHDVPAPAPGPGQVRLRVRRIGVCGSDVHVYHGTHPYTCYPVVQGHEFSAEVERLGEGVRHLRVGQKVTALPQVVCGACPPCRRGDWHICDGLKVRGFQAPGCAQELFVTEADAVVGLPEGFSFEQGALVEPVAVAVHAAGRSPRAAGANVAVLGAGPIGNFVGQVARANGQHVLITDISDDRLAVARQCGLARTCNVRAEAFAEAVLRAFGPDRFEVAFECAGVQETIREAIANIQKGGTIVAVGVFAEPPQVDLGLVQNNELNLHGTLMYQRGDYERAVELIDAGKVATRPLMSRHFAFEEYPAAYECIEHEGDRLMKVFIDL